MTGNSSHIETVTRNGGQNTRMFSRQPRTPGGGWTRKGGGWQAQ